MQEASASITLGVTSETGRLRSVVIGTADTFVLPGPINHKLEKFHAGDPGAPTREALVPEFTGLRAALEARGIEVWQPIAVDGVPDQLTPRDIGVTIGDTFLVTRMLTECRRREWRGLQPMLDRLPADAIVRTPHEVILEGGDVIVHDGTIYVGVGERTNEGGVAFVRETYGDRYEIVAVPLRTIDDGEDVLHLDCAFVPVGAAHALVYPGGLAGVPDALRDRFEWIEVERDEQVDLHLNVLSISPTEVISRVAAGRLNAIMRDIGLDVIEVPFVETPKCGGSFRCASLPLLRDDA